MAKQIKKPLFAVYFLFAIIFSLGIFLARIFGNPNNLRVAGLIDRAGAQTEGEDCCPPPPEIVDCGCGGCGCGDCACCSWCGDK